MPVPYSPPLADITFLLTRLIGVENLAALPGYDSVGEDVIEAVLGEAGKIAGEVFAPLNDVGDKQGAKFENGKMTMPPGFRKAYQAFVDGGWNGLPVETELGGQGLPWTIAMPVQEMLQAANLSLALCTLLNQGAIEAVSVHGDEALRKKFLPKLVSGAWTGTMNLTEPQAGSDVGAVRAKAVKDGDKYRVTGQKIFISYGDHDLAENIAHLVLARLPDAPDGTRGLSLFLVPKILVKDDGSLGEANDVRVVSIEHKLGQHASPTCVMAYGDQGGAIGYLVGAAHGGMAAMFTMMNNARIGVGIQGLALMERSYQQARDFTKTRVQSRDVTKPKNPPVTIIHHPDVRRMLLWMKAHCEAARALAYAAAFSIDVSKRAADEGQKQAAQARVDLLTPIVKSWLTDLANEVTSVGVQVHGGMGYVEETGAAQHMRDARVLAIYEGTNGIQANDLVFRKLARDGSAAFGDMLAEIDAFMPQLAQAKGDDFAAMHKHLNIALEALRASGTWIVKKAKEDAGIAAASAAPFLRLAGNAFGGYYLIKSALLAQEDLAARAGDVDFLGAKIVIARFFAEHVLPLCAGLAATVTEGGGVTVAAAEEMF
ncbi:MAG TPA: acyl-CoA dehydrogenase family protein [Alphaproteobacteria bacterium]|nr:acyl-CoA dehydrogenase family protein [Alphaproteobacteria bacterium]